MHITHMLVPVINVLNVHMMCVVKMLVIVMTTAAPVAIL